MNKRHRERFKELREIAEVQDNPKQLGKLAEYIALILSREQARLKRRNQSRPQLSIRSYQGKGMA